MNGTVLRYVFFSTDLTARGAAHPTFTPLRCGQCRMRGRGVNFTHGMGNLFPKRLCGFPEQVAFDQQLRHLDRVGGRALAQVVAGDPEVEAALVARVAADPAD